MDASSKPPAAPESAAPPAPPAPSAIIPRAVKVAYVALVCGVIFEIVAYFLMKGMPMLMAAFMVLWGVLGFAIWYWWLLLIYRLQLASLERNEWFPTHLFTNYLQRLLGLNFRVLFKFGACMMLIMGPLAFLVALPLMMFS